MTLGRGLALGSVLLLAIITSPAEATDVRATLFDLALGTPLSHLPPQDSFTSYACGTNGGPPGTSLEGWADFSRCAAEADGLREVYFEYDDAEEIQARATGDVSVGWHAGTAYRSFPLMTSALFDAEGTLVGVRLITDPRPEQRKHDVFLHFRPRQEHALLGLYLMGPFGMLPGNCRDDPLSGGETPVLGVQIKRTCDRTDATTGVSYHIEQRYLRRRGETDVDRRTGFLTQGNYLSETRAEMRLRR